MDKYWKAVNDDPTDFTAWTYLLQYVDQEVCYFDAVYAACLHSHSELTNETTDSNNIIHKIIYFK